MGELFGISGLSSLILGYGKGDDSTGQYLTPAYFFFPLYLGLFLTLPPQQGQNIPS